MIWRYLYPLWIHPGFIFEHNETTYKTQHGFYALYVDMEQMNRELGSTFGINMFDSQSGCELDPLEMSEVLSLGSSISFPNIRVHDDTHIQEIDIDTLDGPGIKPSPLVIEKKDRYFLSGDRFIQVCQDSIVIECIDQVNIDLYDEVVEVSEQAQHWPSSPFEWITPIMIPKGSIVNNNQLELIEITKDTGIFYQYPHLEHQDYKGPSDVLSDICSPHIPYAYSLGKDIHEGYPRIYDLKDYIPVQDRHNDHISLEHLVPTPAKRTYKFLDLTVTVDNGYTSIQAPSYVSILDKDIHPWNQFIARIDGEIQMDRNMLDKYLILHEETGIINGQYQYAYHILPEDTYTINYIHILGICKQLVPTIQNWDYIIDRISYLWKDYILYKDGKYECKHLRGTDREMMLSLIHRENGFISIPESSKHKGKYPTVIDISILGYKSEYAAQIFKDILDDKYPLYDKQDDIFL